MHFDHPQPHRAVYELELVAGDTFQAAAGGVANANSSGEQISETAILRTTVPSPQLWQVLLEWRDHLGNEDLSQFRIRYKTTDQAFTRSIPFLDFWRHHFVSGLRDELTRGKLGCKFQSIWTRENREVFGYELLINFKDHDLDLSGGDLFQRVLDEQERLTLEGVSWIACLHALSSLPDGALGFVNLNPEIFFRGITDWRRTMAYLGQEVCRSRIVLELLETSGSYCERSLREFARDCRRRGFLLAIDDWGQHQGNLAILETVRPDFVKLEVEMVRGAHAHRFRRSLVEGVIELCRSLNIKIVLEGIETESDWRWAKASQADFLQGYFLGRPLRLPIECRLPIATISRSAARAAVSAKG